MLGHKEMEPREIFQHDNLGRNGTQSRVLQMYSKHLAALFHPGFPFSLVKRSLTEDTIVFQRKAEMPCE